VLLELSTDQSTSPPPRSLGIFLGSFDPLHRGHEWISGELLGRCERMLLLVPAQHFDQHIVPGRNASLAQRLGLLHLFAERSAGRVLPGVAHRVLFLQIWQAAAAHFPGAELLLGMGNDTFQRLLDSERYFRRAGLPWSAREQKLLQQIAKRTLVFARSAQAPGWIALPRELREVSSTRVRELASRLRAEGASEDRWREALGGWLSPDILERGREGALYRCAQSASPRSAAAWPSSAT